MKKKLIAMLLTGCMALSVAACGAKKEEAKNEEVGQEAALGSSSLLTLGEYKGVSYVPMEITVTDLEVEDEIQYRLLTSGTKENQEIVTETSVVNIDYVGTKDGVAFEGGTAQGQELDIANSHYIEGFAESIVGMKVGETKDCPMTFPADYHSEELAGAEVVFTITVNECWKQPEMNDAFAISQGYESLDAMRAGVRAEYQAYKQAQADNDMIQQLLNKIIEESAFNINEEEVNVYVERDMAEQESYAEMYGMDLETYASMFGLTLEELKTDCRENAVYNIKVPLIQFKIAELEGLVVTDEIYTSVASELMQSYGFTDLATFEATHGKQIIEKMVLAQLAVDVIVENAVAEENIPAPTSAQ